MGTAMGFFPHAAVSEVSSLPKALTSIDVMRDSEGLLHYLISGPISAGLK